MATIRSQMVLNDGISGVLRKINTALNTTLNAFEQVQRASGRAVDTAQIQAARAALVQANREVDEMAEGYRRQSRRKSSTRASATAPMLRAACWARSKALWPHWPPEPV